MHWPVRASFAFTAFALISTTVALLRAAFARVPRTVDFLSAGFASIAGPVALCLGLAIAPSAWAQLVSASTDPAASAPPLAADAAAAAGAAGQAPPLSLPEALALALASNPELAAATREFEAAEGPVLQAAARPNPALSLLLEDTRRATRTTTVQIDQALESGNKRAARVDAAERGRDIAAAELALRRAALRSTVVATFGEVLLGQERVALASEAVALARRAADAAAKRVQAGKVSPVEETRSRIAESTARLEAAQAASELQLARQRLAATWGAATPHFGRAQPAPGKAAGELPVLPALASLEARVQASPAMARARAEVAQRQALTALERSRRLPDVTVSVGLRRDEQLGLNQALLGVSLPLPVFDTNRGKLLEAQRREDKSRDELAGARSGLQSAVLQAHTRLETFGTEARAIQAEVLPGAQSAYDAATKGFELGKFGFLDVLDAQRTLFQARSQLLRALAEAQRAAFDIDRLLGNDHAHPRCGFAAPPSGGAAGGPAEPGRGGCSTGSAVRAALGEPDRSRCGVDAFSQGGAAGGCSMNAVGAFHETH